MPHILKILTVRRQAATMPLHLLSNLLTVRKLPTLFFQSLKAVLTMKQAPITQMTVTAKRTQPFHPAADTLQKFPSEAEDIRLSPETRQNTCNITNPASAAITPSMPKSDLLIFQPPNLSAVFSIWAKLTFTAIILTAENIRNFQKSAAILSLQTLYI